MKKFDIAQGDGTKDDKGFDGDTGEIGGSLGAFKDVSSASVLERNPSRSSTASGISRNLREREKWTNKWEFLMVCISNCVGIGNVWRFPFHVKSNGGGAFLIPYFIVLICISRPLYFMELSLGQFSTKGMIDVWMCVPLFKGVGVTMLMVGYFITSFYAAILAVCVVYFGYSFYDPLPWATCNPDLYTDMSDKLVFQNFSCIDDKAVYNYTNSSGAVIQVGPGNAELFYNYGILNINDDLDNGLGVPQWKLLLGLIGVWIMVFASTLRGPECFGKIAYFLVFFPYIILLVLLLRAVTLPGAGKGIQYFFEPDWGIILTFRVWYDALIQSLWTISVGFGMLTTFGSYNPFNHKLLRDATVIAIADTFTSLLAGAVVFAILGNLSYVSKIPIDKLPGGPGLAFIAYPETLVKFAGDLGLPQFLSVCFFSMLLTLGIGSIASGIQCISATVFDLMIEVKGNVSKPIVHTIVVLVHLVSGLVFITEGGFHILNIVDNSISNYVLFYAVFVEVTAVAYVYGMRNYVKDMKFMIESQPDWYWAVLTWWGYGMPPFLGAVCLYAFVTSKTPTIESPLPKPFPSWVIWAGRLLIIGCMSLLFVVGARVFFTRKEAGWKKKFLATIVPDEAWGPVNSETRAKWLTFREGFDPNTWLYKKIFKSNKGGGGDAGREDLNIEAEEKESRDGE